ncbi:MAG: hypothetical protein SF053_09980 [Bacteroidia bacterium]|nr:hypothetical protein [Bacteroidia bacterium]
MEPTYQYPQAEIIRERFKFLEMYGFSISKEEDLPYGSYIEYIGRGLKIYLGFEYKEYWFDCDFYKGENTSYSDGAYGIDIISLCDLAKKHDHNFDCNYLQSNFSNGYEEVLHRNTMILKKYIDKLLTGEWY